MLDKDKTVKPAEPDKTSDPTSATKNPPNHSGAATAGNKQAADLSEKSWKSSDASGKAWNDSPSGRLAIRMFSRGVMGAAFFTAGSLLTKKWMPQKQSTYNPNLSLREQKNPLQFIAKIIDTVAGKPIEFTVRHIAGEQAALHAVHFRPTEYFYHGEGAKGGFRGVAGRSLGHETVGITFDFFCASIGDAWGRDIAGWFVPNVKKEWIKDGHIDFPATIKRAAKSTWQYVSYNGGEDWAVAIPYVYYMKGQRHLINKMSSGFMYDFDRNKHGGSFKMNDSNHIIGTFAQEGALDLQGRFVTYNIGTLMYREAYQYVADKIRHHPASFYGAPYREKSLSLNERGSNLVKWVMRSVIKGAIYMTPAVPFFWGTRVTQKKEDGLFIHPQHGVLSNYTTNSKAQSIHSGDLGKKIPIGTPIFYGKYDAKLDGNRWTADRSKGRIPNEFPNPLPNQFDSYSIGGNLVDRGFNYVGKLNARAKNLLDKPASWADQSLGKAGHGIKNFLDIQSFASFTNPLIETSISYTPYMYTKAEFARLWDDGKMDLSSERMIDGLTSLNWGEFKTGGQEMWRTFLHRPLADPEREAEAQRRMAWRDTKTADVNLDTSEKQKEDDQPDWRSRIFSDRSAKENKETTKTEAKPTSFAEKEAMRKILEELAPPTNAIH